MTSEPQQRCAPCCSTLEFAALIYLAIPLLIFFLGFAKYALAAAATVTVGIALCRLTPRAPITIGLHWTRIALCALAGAIFLACCGYTSGGARSWDWLKHFAIINELADHPWPAIRADTQTFLRYYLGYYMVPGLLVKLFGNQHIY